MYFYAISRRDLSPEQQAIQAAHAQLEYVRRFGPAFDEHPTFIFLTAKDTNQLAVTYFILNLSGIKVHHFSDPDYDWGQLTAIAAVLSEEDRHLLSDLPLWKVTPKPGRLNWLKALFTRKH